MTAYITDQDPNMPRLSEFEMDLGSAAGPPRMGTFAMLKSELHCLFEENPMVRAVQRTVAGGPGALFAVVFKAVFVIGLITGGIKVLDNAIGAQSNADGQPTSVPAAQSSSGPEPTEQKPAAAALAVSSVSQAAQPQVAEPPATDRGVPSADSPADAPGNRMQAGKMKRGRHMKMKKNKRRGRRRGKRHRRRR